MKKTTFSLISIFIFSFLILGSCKDDDTKPIEPLEAKNPELQKMILGKWDLIKKGYGSNLWDHNPGGAYMEYLADWDVLYYNLRGAGFKQDDMYRIDSTYIYEYYKYPAEGGRRVYEYAFSGDSLKLKVIEGNITNANIFIFKRKK